LILFAFSLTDLTLFDVDAGLSADTGSSAALYPARERVLLEKESVGRLSFTSFVDRAESKSSNGFAHCVGNFLRRTNAVCFEEEARTAVAPSIARLIFN